MRKIKGRRQSFPEDVQRLIAKRYLIDNESSYDLAKEFAPLSRTGKLSAGGVRLIASRHSAIVGGSDQNMSGAAST